MSLQQPVTQILKVRAWFTPGVYKPPSVLETKLTNNFWLKFDSGLLHFGLLSNRMENVYYKSQNYDSTVKRSALRRFYCYLVTCFLLFNVGRFFATFFIKDPYYCMMIGDFSHNWLKKRHIANGPLLFLGMYASIVQFIFCYYSEWVPKLQNWLFPFTMFRGLITPTDAHIRSVHQLVILREDIKVNFKFCYWNTYVWTLLVAVMFYSSAMTGYDLEYSLITILWATVQSLWAYYVIGILTWSLGYFHTLCFYLRVRYKRLNYIVRYMREEGTLTNRKRNELMKEVTLHHSLTSNDVGYWNRFWKFYCLATYFAYMPLEFWLLYAVIWVESHYAVTIAFWALFFEIAIFLGILIGSGETVSNQAHLPYRWLNYLCIQEYPINLKLKVAMLLERLGGPTIGFTCYDFFTVARETFYDMIIIVGSYFFLVMDFVVSYM